MRTLPLFLLLVFALPATAAGLNDTGQTKCYDNGAEVACDAAHIGNAGTFPRQDARFGRDAQAGAGLLAKIGSGQAGFDFTKIGNNGSALAASATLGGNPTNWACTRDNVTGLIWEVKTTSGLRNSAWTYTWYDGSTGTPDGGAGLNGDTCSDAARCDTQKFVADVNAANLCGYADWRLPTQLELLSIVHNGTSLPAIDTSYFPDEQQSITSVRWAAESYAPNPAQGRCVVFYSGHGDTCTKASDVAVRLVRGGQ